MSLLPNKTHHGDAKDLIRLIPDNSIDLVLTDPPYNIDLSYDVYKDTKTEKEFWQDMKDIFTQLYRVMKDKRHLIFTCAQKQIWVYRPMLEEIGFEFRHLGIWHNPKRKAGGYPGQWPYAWEAIMDFTKNGFRKLNNGNSVGTMDVWIEEEPKDFDHPAKRPVNCWLDLLTFGSFEHELVLDPFMGSGTTAYACATLKRNWIGIDLSKKYVKMSNSRTARVSSVEKWFE